MINTPFKMKALAYLALAFFGLQACQDSATAMLEDADFSDAENEVLISEMEEECGRSGHFEFAEELRGPHCGDWKEKLPECAVVTESGDSYPKTITIEFGEDCEGKHGRKRSGKMTIVVSDDMKNEGATRTVTFERFGMEDHSMEGTKVIKNIGVNSEGNYVFSRTMTMEGTGRKGDFSRVSEGEIEWISGFDTEDCYDNIVSITGSSSTTNSDGEVVGSREITAPIVRSFNCKHPVSGIVVMSGAKGNAQIDFGNGSCDSEATVTKDDVETEIDLDKRRENRGKRRPRK